MRLQRAVGAEVLSLDPRPAGRGREHITDQWLPRSTRTVRRRAPPRIRVDSASRAPAPRPRWREAPRFATCADPPGQRRARAKCWPLDTFALAAALARAGCAVRFILGPAERERLSPAAQQQLSDAAPLLAPSDACDLAATLSVATLYVGNDSGVSHLAAAVGAPTVAIFGATDPRVWRPLGDSVHVLGGPQGFPALADVERVVTAQLRALRDVAARSAAE
ncbi:MAG: glycosyltransferase family 9 protein [Phycisphaerae bacterium]